MNTVNLIVVLILGPYRMGGIDEVSNFRKFTERSFIISLKDMWEMMKLNAVLPDQTIMCGNENMIMFRLKDNINIQQNVEFGGVCGFYRDGIFYDYCIGEMSIEDAFERMIDGFAGQDFI